MSKKERCYWNDQDWFNYWEDMLKRKLTEDEKRLVHLTEGEIDLRSGYCPSLF